MENGGSVFSRGVDTNYVARRIIMKDAVCAALYRIRAWRNHKVEARAEFRIHIICIGLSIIGHYWKMAIK